MSFFTFCTKATEAYVKQSKNGQEQIHDLILQLYCIFNGLWNVTFGIRALLHNLFVVTKCAFVIGFANADLIYIVISAVLSTINNTFFLFLFNLYLCYVWLFITPTKLSIVIVPSTFVVLCTDRITVRLRELSRHTIVQNFAL